MNSEDQILAELAKANPVPSPADTSSPTAQAMVNSVLDDRQRFESFQAQGPKPQPRRWGALVSVAAAIALLVGAVAVLAPSSSTPAMAAVQTATQNTAQASSGRVTTTFELSGQSDDEEGSASGRILAAFNGDDLSVTADIISLTGDVESDSDFDALDAVELRLVDDTIYLSEDSGASWMATSAPTALGDSLIGFLDGRQLLDLIAEVAEVEEIGTEDLDGPVTHYRGHVDLSDTDRENPSWLPSTGDDDDLEVDGLVVIDVWVGDDGFIRRAQAEGSVNDEAEDVTFSVLTELTDLNNGPTIVAPETNIETFGFFDDEEE